MKKKRMMALLLTGFMAASTLAGFGGISVYAAPEEEASQQTSSPNILMIARQGMFSSGGTVTAPVEGDYDATTNWLDATRAGNTAHVGQPRRGEAGSTVMMSTDGFLDAWSQESKAYKPGDQAWYTHFRIGRTAPERYEGSQFPESAEAQDQFFRQMTPNTGDYDQEVDAAALSEVMGDVYTMTGNKSIFVTHFQGGAVGWDVDMDYVSAIVAVEPGGTPEVGSKQYQKLLESKIPIIILFGDYIDNGPADIRSTEFWKSVRDGAVGFAESYNAAGGDCTVINLPDLGVTGNSHFMFQEENNGLIADYIAA